MDHHNGTYKVLIYVRSPEIAQEIVVRSGERLGPRPRVTVALLTGTIRGYERDQLVRENQCTRRDCSMISESNIRSTWSARRLVRSGSI